MNSFMNFMHEVLFGLPKWADNSIGTVRTYRIYYVDTDDMKVDHERSFIADDPEEAIEKARSKPIYQDNDEIEIMAKFDMDGYVVADDYS